MSLASDQRQLLSRAQVPVPPLDRYGQGRGSSDNPDSPQKVPQTPNITWPGEEGESLSQSHT